MDAKNVPSHLALLSYEKHMLESYRTASWEARAVILERAIKDKHTSGPLISAYRAADVELKGWDKVDTSV